MTKPGLLLFMTDINAAHETEFHRWYEEEHIPERLAIPGFLTARRFQTLEGSPKYLAINARRNVYVGISERRR